MRLAIADWQAYTCQMNLMVGEFFQSLRGQFKKNCEHWQTRWQAQPGAVCHDALFWSFWLSLASFPIGYGAREVLPLVCLVFLLGYYRFDWHGSVLARLEVKPFFYALWLMVILGVALSQDVWASFLHAGTAVNKGFILPFIGMECVRDSKDLRRLVCACVLACFWEGLDGVWQAATGRDFIMGYRLNAGRLTGSLGDYTVGNYIALALIPAFGLHAMLRQKCSPLMTAFLCMAVLWPAFFLFLGASSRSGLLALIASFGLWAFMVREKWQWRILLFPALLGWLFLLLQPKRMAAGTIADDGRWSLWNLAWQVICEHPWFGAGPGQYNQAFRALGLAPARDAITISHPHNIFLDLLYAHGIIGFSLGMVFLVGFVVWGYRQIRPRLVLETGQTPYCNQTGQPVYWTLATWFWIAFVCWLVNGIFGHDFYRIWWFAQAMSYLGVMIGAVVNGRAPGNPVSTPLRTRP